MTSAESFAKLWVSLPTFFDEKGALDDRALEHLVDYLLSRPAAGLALLTEGAEDAVLLPEERRRVVELVARRAKGRKEVMVQVSALSTREAIDLARLAEARGASAVLVSVARTPGLGYRELYRHLDRVGRATGLPCILVHRPECASDRLTGEELATLAQHDRLRGVHLPEASTAQLEAWTRRLEGKPAEVLSGCALAFAPSARAGANGVVCGLSALAVDASAQLLESLRRGDVEAVRALESRTAPAVALLGPPRAQDDLDGVRRLATRLAQRPLEGSTLRPSVPFAAIKEGLRLQGHPVKAIVRPPFEPLGPAEVERLRGALRASGLVS